MEALLLPVVYSAVAVLRRLAPNLLDGTLVNVVAIGVGLGVSFGIDVTFFEQATELLDQIASGIAIGLGSSAFDVTLKAVKKPSVSNINIENPQPDPGWDFGRGVTYTYDGPGSL